MPPPWREQFPKVVCNVYYHNKCEKKAVVVYSDNRVYKYIYSTKLQILSKEFSE